MVGIKSSFNAWDSNQDFSSKFTINNTSATQDSLRIYDDTILTSRFRNATDGYEIAFGVNPTEKYNAFFTVDVQWRRARKR